MTGRVAGPDRPDKARQTEANPEGGDSRRLLSDEILAQRIKAQKRAAIGLAPERATAGRVLYRPAQSAPAPFLRWFGVILAGLLLAASLWFVLETRPNLPTPSAQASPGGDASRPGEVQLLRYEFDQPVATMAQHIEPGAWAMGFVDGFYRIRSVTAGSLVYTTLGLRNPDPYRLESALTISTETPWSYGGIMARVQDGQNFYLFWVDGEGGCRATLMQAGRSEQVGECGGAQVYPAGQSNQISLADDGASLTFAINGVTVIRIEEIRLPAGDLALVGGSAVEPGSEADFDWVAVYQIP